MQRLHVGLRIMHNGSPVELLYEISPNTWRVKMLFIIAEDRTESFGEFDRISLLHSKAA